MHLDTKLSLFALVKYNLPKYVIAESPVNRQKIKCLTPTERRQVLVTKLFGY